MDKLKMQTINLVEEKIQKIANIFPNCIVESQDASGVNKKMIDFIALKQELSNFIVEESDERYTMSWPDKKKTLLTVNSPIAMTLRPLKDKSVNFDNTQNIYIEGDNLDVLKLLRETYLNKIQMIYIDPPYNTGNDFVYEDDFSESIDSYLLRTNQLDEQGLRMVSNTESNGRFHTDWLNMMYSRLKVARDLLSDDGVIFISIDDNEQANLKKICDEIFGASCFCGVLIQNKGNAQNDARNLQKNHEYILCYFKNSNSNFENVLSSKEIVEKEVFYDSYGYFYKGSGLVTGGEGGTLNRRPNLGHTIYYNEDKNDLIAVQDYDISKAKISNNESEVYSTNADLISKGYVAIRPPKKGSKLGVWTWSLEKINSEKKDLLVSKSKDGYTIYKKVYTKENVYKKNGKEFVSVVKDMPSRSILDYSTAKGSLVVNELLGMKIFDNPKNMDLIMYLINLYNNKNITVLDFFSGSATTAHAVMEQNLLDGGNRKFIVVQLPEICNDINIELGYNTICDIGQQRIVKAGENIFRKNSNIDVGFRTFKLDTSCMKDIYYDPNKLNQDLLAGLEDNIKEDRTPEDLLFQVMLDMGVMLSSEIKILDIQGKKVFNVNEGNLVCCFDKNLTDEVVTEIAKMKPLYAVFRDSSMAKDSVAVNFDQIFETYSSETVRKVL